ncbi:3-hydroxyisobutyrate dehydrogenase [Sphingomonas radiodurans]|uniref:3-hydroxyisobutyrate dehydrogenase n=1 Tax=Sphingomonas radiodurans TaxID=2890321 RepID=UPI001E3D68F2|nr:3-hydroxyisobutyrate dehydrogenase [Sphingomonas radiodurans]WBH16249.1 3-hydroxyisobutyrate dehydrogenase [Sphingomonas radiodurans]
MARVAFIGLGNMGGGMAANLAKAGHDVRAFDLSPEALDRAKAAGCLPVASAAEAVDGAEAIITMLPAGKHVAQVYAEAVFGNAPPAAILIDCSTIDVTTARQVATDAQAKGLEAVDAPVSGGIAAANAGTLTFMVGGSQSAFELAQPFLEAMGKAVIHAGASGAGQAVKMCNNLILGATMIATCEGFALAEKLGLDAQTFYDIASKATAQSWSMTSYCPVPGVGPESPADRDYQGGFAAALMLKDLRLAMDAAEQAGATVPMGTRSRDLYEAFADAGHGNLDFSAIIKTFQSASVQGTS